MRIVQFLLRRQKIKPKKRRKRQKRHHREGPMLEWDDMVVKRWGRKKRNVGRYVRKDHRD